VERAPALRGGGYMIDSFGPGYDAAERAGLLPALAAIHEPIPRLRFVDARGREKFALAYPALRHLLADRHFNFLRGDLERALYEQVRRDVAVRFGTSVAAFAEEGALVRVHFEDGTAACYDLLVRADGVHSRVRSLAFGAEARFARFLGYTAAAFFLDDTPPGVLRDAFTTLTAPGRQVAVYPIRDGRLATFFVHRAGRRSAAGSPAAARDELRQVYGDLGWVVPALLEAARATDPYFDAVEQIALPCWSRGRVTLVGDACGCVSLLAGQGASLAVAGAAILAEELSAGEATPAAALARYEARLRPAVVERQRAGRRMARWFVPGSAAGIAARDLLTL
jgi:2-polyprenyl-6-methoxyphenol hydroxylase-like FAD-dependent oxidoreductase